MVAPKMLLCKKAKEERKKEEEKKQKRKRERNLELELYKLPCSYLKMVVSYIDDWTPVQLSSFLQPSERGLLRLTFSVLVAASVRSYCQLDQKEDWFSDMIF